MQEYTFMNRPAAKALYFALTEDPFYITLEKKSDHDPDRAREAMFRYLDYSLKEARDHGRAVFTQDQCSGAAIWSKPLDPGTAKELSKRKKEFIQEQLGQESLSFYSEIVEFMSCQSKGVVDDNSWYLSILGILPDCQGQGLGKQLMMPILKETYQLGLPAYAESFTPKNFKFYMGLGFTKAKTIDEPITGSSYTILVREPAQYNRSTK